MAIGARRRRGSAAAADAHAHPADDDARPLASSSSSPSPPPANAVAASALLDEPRLLPFRHLPWTVYRGVAYDLSSFRDSHPGGRFLIDLAVHRDSTALVESYHLRTEVARRVIEGSGKGGGKGGLLPVIKGFPLDAVEASPRPDDSDFYVTVKRRVRAEVFGQQQGQQQRQEGATTTTTTTTTTPPTTPTKSTPTTPLLLHPRRGSERAMLCVLFSASLAYLLFALSPGIATGVLLGLTGAWIGVTVQHCGNHGAMSKSALVNQLLGFCDDLIGGSSLVWRYHHQVSHHVHTNDGRLDEDVVSMYPLLRFDARLPRQRWHSWQHLYVWFVYPFMHLAFQWGDVGALVMGRTPGAQMSGATAGEKWGLVFGKVLHFAGLLLVPAVGVPLLLPSFSALGEQQGAGEGGLASWWSSSNGSSSDYRQAADAAAPPPPPAPSSSSPAAAAAASFAASSGDGLLLSPAAAAWRWHQTLRGALAYSVVLSFVLALMFFVSHNVPENKPLRDGNGNEGEEQDERKQQQHQQPHLPARAALLAHPAPAARDWGLQQVLASSNWGGSLANFFTGGLNLQIEHHLFPAVAFDPHYPRIALVVQDECAKRGLPYSSHPSLFSILGAFFRCMRELGAADDEPGGLEADCVGERQADVSSGARRPRFALPADGVRRAAADEAARAVAEACGEARRSRGAAA